MGKLAITKLVCFIVLLAAPHIAPAQVKERSQSSSSAPSTKVTVGVVEDVVLSPWGVTFPARIDTGADLSSLDARDIVVENNIVAFKLGKRYGDLELSLPVVEWRYIQTAMGTERRPVVEISICLGSKLLRTPVTLKDRSEMIYPFLVGRAALRGDFLVDPSRSRAARPSCPAKSLSINRVSAAAKD